MSDLPDLELSGPAFEALVAEAAAFCARLLDGLARAHAAGTVGREGFTRARQVRGVFGEAPVEGGLSAVLPILERAFEASLMTAGPGYLAYVPGGGLPVAAVADLVADVANRYAGLAEAAPGPCALEDDVIRFLAREVGFGPASSGLLLSGGSLANFTALVAARENVLPPGADLRRAVVYTSSQVHHSVAKSVRLCGLPPGNVRAVAVDGRLRMEPDALAEAVEADRRAGRLPMCVVSSAGTTNTGAVDPLPRIANVARDAGIWHHVDGAYGGAFVLCEEGRRILSGIERADSVTVDPHKGLFLPYGTGCLLVRDRAALARAFRMGAGYLQDFDEAPDEVASPAHLGPELSRPFRGLRLWLAFALHGVGAFRRALAEKLELARTLAARLAALSAEGVEIEVVDPPQLSVVAFRLRRRPGQSGAEADAENAALLRAVASRGRVFLSSTRLPGPDGPRTTLRACVLSFRTHADRIEAACEDVAAAARALRPGGGTLGPAVV